VYIKYEVISALISLQTSKSLKERREQKKRRAETQELQLASATALDEIN